MHRRPALNLLSVVLLAACTATPVPTGSPAPVTPAPAITAAPSAAAPSAAATAAATTAPTVAPPTAPPPAGTAFSIFPAEPAGELRTPFSCAGSIEPNDPVAIVSLPNPNEDESFFSLVNLADGTPREVCRLPEGGSPLDLLDATHLVVVAGTDPVTFDDRLAVVEVPTVRYEWFQIPGPGEDLFTRFVALSPTRDAMTWLRTDYGKLVEQVHLATAEDDSVLASFAIDGDGRCCSIEDSKIGAFSSSGRYGFVLRQPIAQQASLTVFEGTDVVLSIVPPEDDGRWAGDRHPGMALWAPGSDTLYYRKGRNVYRWERGSEPTVFLDGVKWYDPTFSADGRWLAFTTYRDDDTTDLYVVDMAARSPKPELLEGRAGQPSFLSSTLLWYVGEDVGCTGPTSEPTLYDMATGTASATDISGVFSAWPATSSR